MNRRHFNILFHTHTISGMVISVALYVIFFTGSFSFFRDEIVNWERGQQPVITDEIGIHADSLISELTQQYDLYGRDIKVRHYYNERRVSVDLGPGRDSLAAETERQGAFFYMDMQDRSRSSYAESYTLGEFLYRLHFFAQIPYPYGYYLSGLVAFFFLFAIITGLIIHWKKIISGFYVFRPRAKLKTVWTDAHTALGLIGFPFQLVYALTGTFFMLKAVLIAPFVWALYQGDQQQFYQELGFALPTYTFAQKPMADHPAIQNLVLQTKQDWPGFKATELQIFNYGDINMHVAVEGHLSYNRQLNGVGKRVYRLSDQQVVFEHNPLAGSTYVSTLKNLLYRLHFADYAGYGLRIIAFILGLISCFVILSGIMIWLMARDRKQIPERTRRINHWLATVFLAICLSLYPMVALEFLLVRMWPEEGMAFLYRTFFWGWLLWCFLFVFIQDHAMILKISLAAGAVLGLCIPWLNGWQTGQWFWIGARQSIQPAQVVDLLWLLCSLSSMIALYQWASGKYRMRWLRPGRSCEKRREAVLDEVNA